MIPQKFVDFVHGPVVSWIGTRDQRLHPEVTWVLGARVDAANDLITCFVPDVEADQTMSNLAQNSMVAFTVAEGLSHEAYQFKGRLVETRPTTGEERAVQDIHKTKLTSHYTHYPEGLFPNYIYYPSTAVTFRVEEIFVQTPGPGAGDRIDVAAEAG